MTKSHYQIYCSNIQQAGVYNFFFGNCYLLRKRCGVKDNIVTSIEWGWMFVE